MQRSKFQILWERIEKLHHRLSEAHRHFQIWKTFRKLVSIDDTGEDIAKKNLDIINSLIGFFGPTMEAHRKIFAIELAKFFDKTGNNLSIFRAINFIRGNKKYLSKEDFISFDPDRDCLDSLAKNYEGIQEEDLKKCEDYVEEKKEIILKLKTFRDQNLAHDDIKKKDISLSIEEVEGLFQLASKILNLISGKLNHSTWSHFRPIENPKESTEELIENLKEFRKHKDEEFERKYGFKRNKS